MTDELYLFATIADTAVAIPATQVEAVARLGELVPVHGAANHVRGLAALRSRVLTVIDMRARVHGLHTSIPARPLAVVAECGGHAYGLLIDSVSDICLPDGAAQPVLGRLHEAWAPFARDIIEMGGRSHLIVSVDDFVAVAA